MRVHPFSGMGDVEPFALYATPNAFHETLPSPSGPKVSVVCPTRTSISCHPASSVSNAPKASVREDFTTETSVRPSTATKALSA